MRSSAWNSKKLVLVSIAIGIELVVFHADEWVARHRFLAALYEAYRLTQDWQSDVLADQVRIWAQLDQVCVGEALTKLAYKTLFNDLLVAGLVICDLQSALLGERAT